MSIRLRTGIHTDNLVKSDTQRTSGMNQQWQLDWLPQLKYRFRI